MKLCGVAKGTNFLNKNKIETNTLCIFLKN